MTRSVVRFLSRVDFWTDKLALVLIQVHLSMPPWSALNNKFPDQTAAAAATLPNCLNFSIPVFGVWKFSICETPITMGDNTKTVTISVHQTHACASSNLKAHPKKQWTLFLLFHLSSLSNRKPYEGTGNCRHHVGPYREWETNRDGFNFISFHRRKSI